MPDTPDMVLQTLYAVLKDGSQPNIDGIAEVHDYEPGPGQGLGGNYQTLWYAGGSGDAWLVELRSYIDLTPGPREAQQTLRRVLADTEELIPDSVRIVDTVTDWWEEGRKLVGMLNLEVPRSFA